MSNQLNQWRKTIFRSVKPRCSYPPLPQFNDSKDDFRFVLSLIDLTIKNPYGNANRLLMLLEAAIEGFI